MKYILLFLITVALIAPVLLHANQTDNSPAPAPVVESKSSYETDSRGWRNIMPGKNLKDWSRLPLPATGKLGREQWHVDISNKLLVCDGDGGHDWLRYDKEFKNLIFHVEWRFTPVEGKTGYNSGVFIRNLADGTVWHQAQCGNKNGGFIFGDTMVAGKLQRVNLSKSILDQRVKPAGEWNTYELTARGENISLWVNGAITSQFEACEILKGYVGLEGEGWRIEFRNLKIKHLK